jgi:hypothetical protein
VLSPKWGWLVTQNPHPARKILVGLRLAPILKKFRIADGVWRLRAVGKPKLKSAEQARVNLVQAMIYSIRARHAKFGPSAIPSIGFREEGA